MAAAQPTIRVYEAYSQLSFWANANKGSDIMGSTFNGLVGLIILALDIWAIINVVKSSAGMGAKILWILLILLLPVLGLIIWAIAGPRGNVRL